MELKHVISSEQFLDKYLLEKIFNRATELEKMDKNQELPRSMRGKVLVSLFYQPSTRTRFSFDAAVKKLGGEVIGTEHAGMFSSVTKGETLEDTIQIVNGYGDIIVIRHYEEGSAQKAASISSIPVINAGDGPGEHPTQTLLDIYTIKKELGKLDNLKIALVGDLLYGRTIHSLIKLLHLFDVKAIYLVSPKELKLPKKYTDYLKSKDIRFQELESFENILSEIDVLYITRIQKEVFETLNKLDIFEKVKGSYIVNKEVVNKLNKKSIVMHPLPRVNELSMDVDNDPRAAYFRQARNGLYIRMALLEMVTGYN